MCAGRTPEKRVIVMKKENKFRDYRMIGLSVKAVVSAVPIAAIYVIVYLFLSSLSGLLRVFCWKS